VKAQVIKTLKAALMQIEASSPNDVSILRQTQDIAKIATAANSLLIGPEPLGNDATNMLKRILTNYNKAMRVNDEIFKDARFVAQMLDPKDNL
jgi:hypothetical protein